MLKLKKKCITQRKKAHNQIKVVYLRKTEKRWQKKDRIKLIIIEMYIKPNGWSSGVIVFIIQDLLKILTNYKAIRYAFWVPL